jgi:hypothetical protein
MSQTVSVLMTALMLGRDEDPHKSLAFLVGRVFRLDGRFDGMASDIMCP